MQKVRIEQPQVFKDGGSVSFFYGGERYWIDNRIGTTSKGTLYRGMYGATNNPICKDHQYVRHISTLFMDDMAASNLLAPKKTRSSSDYEKTLTTLFRKVFTELKFGRSYFHTDIHSDGVSEMGVFTIEVYSNTQKRMIFHGFSVAFNFLYNTDKAMHISLEKTANMYRTKMKQEVLEANLSFDVHEATYQSNIIEKLSIVGIDVFKG